MERYYLIFKGRVQGVGFRFFVYMMAERYHLTGSVKNLASGDVEAYMQGEKTAIDNFLYALFHEHNYFTSIDDYSMKKLPLVKEDSFRILY